MLRSLELFGFKSFADRTRFDFASGITCVVGPNGSGKSNVVDSIKWILGDQSAKSLRGKEMTDVIFNGSASRKPSGFAEATLRFDNTSRFLGIDADEVLVGRRLYRSGESEYLINKAPSRLKDVRDLLMGTGAGSAAYSIIEQGRVDQLLQASNVNRRAVFEEAAGVSRFKSRKIDAQRKLERVEQNLLRLKDIVDELGGRLHTMRQHAQKASRYRKYSTEMRELRVGYAADEYRELTSEFGSISHNHDGWQSEIDRLKSLSSEIEQQQADLEDRLTQVEDRLQDSQKQTAANREEIAGLRATAGHQKNRQEELAAELQRLQQQQTNLAHRARDIAGELETTETDLQQFAANLTQRQQDLSQREQQLSQSGKALTARLQQLESEREQILESKQRAAVLSGRVAAADARIKSVQTAIKTDEQQIAKLQVAISAAKSELARVEKRFQELDAQKQEFQQQLTGVRQTHGELAARKLDGEMLLNDLRGQHSGGEARLQVLQDLESRQEGVAVGVREILNRARESNFPPWNQIRGSVADLLQVDLEHAALIEVALGSRAQLIVLDDADPLLEYLQEAAYSIAGRVGFLAIALTEEDHAVGPDRSRVDLSEMPGVVTRADRLVRSATETPGLAAQLLNTTWIVSSLRDALQLSKSHGTGLRFVTLQGELLESDGTIFAGSLQSDSTVVSRRSELRRLKNELARLTRRIDESAQSHQQTLAELQSSDEALKLAEQQLEQCQDALSEQKSSVRSHEMECERLGRELEAAQQSAAERIEEYENARNERAEAASELEHVEEQLKSAEQTLRTGESQLKQLEDDLVLRRDQLGAEKLELAKQEERMQNLQNTRSRLGEEQTQRDAHREEAERRLAAVRLKRDRLKLQFLNTTAAVSEQLLVQEQLTAELTRRESERNQVRDIRSRLAAEELKHRHALREVEERAHEQEMLRRDLKHKLSNLEERLQEEFGVSLVQVAEQGASAIRMYLEQSASEQRAQESANRADDHHEDAETSESPEPAADPDDVSSATVVPLDEVPPDVIAEIRKAIEERIATLRRKLKSIGSVSSDSLQELEELESRFTKLDGQLRDLTEAKNSLEEIIRRINSESRRMFKETFEEIRKHFQELFRKLFGGGNGDIILEDAEDILECGIDIVARPPGKELRSISLLSGGEKTLTAVALLFALFQSRPSPFCILDEVDAALDEANIERYVGVIEEFQNTTQFIVITHAKRTMVGADVLYGVTMEESGISKRMSVRFEDVSPDGNFKIPAHGDQDASTTDAA